MLLFAGTLNARDHGRNEHENQQCSNATLHGSYALDARGTIINVGPFAAVGVFTFGNGNLSATLAQKVNGNVVPITVAATYK